MNRHIQSLISRGNAMRQQMWRSHEQDRPTAEALFYATMRVAEITFSGIKENRIIIRAAALSFSSLLGLGPIIALMVLVSGFVLDKTQPDMAQNAIESAIQYVAPQVSIGSNDEETNELGSLISRFIESSKSGAVGIGGAVMLIFIVIQLFTTIEDAFNDIWGVQRGRSLITRVIMYWTTISLGALLVFAGLAVLISEAVKLNSYLGNGIGEWFAVYGTKLGSFMVIVGVLAAFYRFIPNTQVEWRAALIGAVFTVLCFSGLNMLAFLYVERVAMQTTLYGSLALPLVLLIGFYFTWLFLLLGGRVSFAVQNARFKGGKIAWDELSHAAKESLCLLLFVEVCRQFQNCGEPLSSKELASRHGLPRQLTSSALYRLSEIGLTSLLPPDDETPFDANRYQPAKPLDKIKLTDFKRLFEAEGHTPDENLFDSYDPIVAKYHKMIDDAREMGFGSKTFQCVLKESDT